MGDNFTPEVGFVRRDDMRKSYAQFRFSPRPAQPSIVRKYSWVGSGTYVEDTAGRVETREVRGEVAIEFQSSDRISARYTGSYEFLPRPFRIAPDVVIPIGGYSFGSLDVGMNFGQHRPVYGSVSVQHGTFFDGKLSTGAGRGDAEALTGAELLDQPRRSPGGVVYRESGRHSSHLHDDPPHVRERPGPVQLER